MFSSPLMPHFCFCRHIARKTLNITNLTWKRARHNKWSLFCQHKAQRCNKLDGNSMAAPVEAPTASLSDVECPTASSVPELHGTPHTISSGQLAGSPEETNTKPQKPHGAVFIYRRALDTSLWKICVATLLFLQIKAKGN